jgi:hypothetical protein
MMPGILIAPAQAAASLVKKDLLSPPKAFRIFNRLDTVILVQVSPICPLQSFMAGERGAAGQQIESPVEYFLYASGLHSTQTIKSTARRKSLI